MYVTREDDMSGALRLQDGAESTESFPSSLPVSANYCNARTVQDESSFSPPPAYDLHSHPNPTETLIEECTRWGAFADSPYGHPALTFPEGADPFAGITPLSPGWQERVIRESRILMQNYKTSAEILEIVSSDTASKLSPEEEHAICAVVPKLVRVSMNGPVRGVYLDRSRALWRANWREGGRVRTKGFRIAKWGSYEARRKAIEVRKLMETRACFLRLKAVAYGFTRGLKRSHGSNSRYQEDSRSSGETWTNPRDDFAKDIKSVKASSEPRFPTTRKRSRLNKI